MAVFAEAGSKYLPDSHRSALFSALCILSDEFFDYDLEDQDHIFRELLPSKYLNPYTPLFLKKFYTALLTVGYKPALPRESETPIACTAEELALHILIEQATGLLEIDGIEAAFGDFEDAIYQDLDFEYLFDPAVDGIEDSEEGKEMAICNLRFSDWFKPFDNSMPVHTLCQEEAAYDGVDELPNRT